ncbi:hypothetical protein F5141DRAFT_1061988 [Pisolithus sp. B1]|nr:hypothetical protein F5141DRAFT_1061988 [Pisolithus sp. B1]
MQGVPLAVNADPACPWGHEAKYVALHGAKRYDEAIDAFKSMLHAIEQSNDPAINRQRKNYISPSDTVKAIDSIVSGVLKNCPLIVIDVTTGYLCNGSERIRIFKADPLFKELVSSMTTNLDNERIRQDVSRVKSVWKLPDTPLSEKLRNFCKEAYTLGHKWAWSDTCCIDKDKSSILDQSLASMYKWYAESAATVVFLADVAHPAKFGDLFASPSKPLSRSLRTISGVHEKLRLASTRIASVGEDVVYSLIGIFKSDIRPYYGEGQADALGHLLEEIVNRSGEVTVLAWSGKSSKSSSYNSCLPASISAYSQTTYGPPSLEVFLSEDLVNARGSENLYRAEVSGLGNVEFATTDNLLKGKRQKIVFAHPWIHRILGRSSGVACHWAGDLDFDADSESDDNTSLDEVLSSYTVSALGVDHYIPALQDGCSPRATIQCIASRTTTQWGVQEGLHEERDCRLGTWSQCHFQNHSTEGLRNPVMFCVGSPIMLRDGVYTKECL